MKFLCKATDENNQTVNYDGKFYTETGDLSINISFNPVPWKAIQISYVTTSHVSVCLHYDC